MGTLPDAVGLERPIGRDLEVQRMLDVVRQRRSSFLHGAAGIGKSHVLREVARRAREDGADVVALSGTEATTVVPLAPLLRLCPPGAAEVGPAIMAELYRRSRERLVIVLVDDAHLLDDATAALVRQMAAAAAVGLAVAVRSGEGIPASVDAIRRDGDALVLELQELDRTASRELTRLLLGPTAEETLQWVFRRSRGHPLYQRELIAAARQTGALAQVHGRWSHDRDAPVWTARLHALVAGRLRGLSPPERRAVEFAAVGGVVPIEVCRTIVSLDVLVGLANRRLLSLDGDTVELDHPVIAEIVTTALSPSRAAAVRRQLADAIDAHSHDPVAVAELRLDAGADLDRELLEKALSEALQSRRPRAAERFARLACESEATPELRMQLVHALAVQRRWAEAEEQLKQLLTDVGDEAGTGLLERWVALNFEYRDELATTRDIAVRAREEIRDRSSPQFELAMLRLDLFLVDLDRVIADHDRWLVAREPQDALRQLALVDVATAGWHAGAHDRVMDAVAEFDRTRVSPDPVERARLRGVHLATEAWRSGADAWSGPAGAAVADDADSADADVELLAHLHQGIALNDLARYPQAAEHLQQVLDLTTYARHRRHLPTTQAELARALLGTRLDSAEVVACIESISPLSEQTRFVTEPIIQLVLARLAELDGSDPWPALELGLRRARQRAARLHEIVLLRSCSRLRPTSSVTARLRRLADEVGGGLAELVAREAEALAARDPQRLDRVAVDAAAFGATGIAADAAAHAAHLHARADRPGAAYAAQYRCDRILRAAPGQRSHVRDALEPVLSSREHQVVQAVLAGAANREVGEQLFISHRTVESHLRRVYARLRVRGREELAALVGPSDVELPQRITATPGDA